MVETFSSNDVGDKDIFDTELWSLDILNVDLFVTGTLGKS